MRTLDSQPIKLYSAFNPLRRVKKRKGKKEEKVLAIWCRCNNCKFVYHMLNVHDKRFALITRIMLMIKSTAAVAMNESLLDKC